MLDELKFVRNAVAKKDFVPGLCHFRICDNRITGYNGELAISTPVAIDYNIAPSAPHFMKAINACNDTITLKMRGQKLEVRSGRFKTNVPCIGVDEVPVILPLGKRYDLDINLVDCFKKLLPFVGVDASKPWACGVLLRGQSAFATNNIVLIEHWIGGELPIINIPTAALVEVVRYKKQPSYLLVDTNRVTFCYDDGSWISHSLSILEWPNVEDVINVEDANYINFPEGFFEAVEQLTQFSDDLKRFYFIEDHLATSKDLDEAATVECPNCPPAGCFNLKIMQTLEGVSTMVDFTKWPAPAPFVGDGVRGVVVGYRQ